MKVLPAFFLIFFLWNLVSFSSVAAESKPIKPRFHTFHIRDLVKPWFDSLDSMGIKVLLWQDQSLSEVDESLLLAKEPTNSDGPPQRGVVFSLGVASPIDYELLKHQKKEYRKLTFQMRKFVHLLANLRMRARFFGAKNLDERIDLLVDEYNKHLHKRQKLYLMSQYEEGKKINKILDQTLPRLKNDWELVTGSRVDQILRFASSNQYTDIVIIGHGNASGTLFDSRHNLFHSDFFSRLTPMIRSVSIFSCYGNEVVQKYFRPSPLKVGGFAGFVISPVSKSTGKPKNV